MLSSLIKFFGMSGNKTQKEKEFEKYLEELRKKIPAMRGKTFHFVLTEEIIDSTPDEKLLQVVFDNLWTKIAGHYDDEHKIVMSWNKSRQAIYLTWTLEGQVNNGGFNQLYSNSSKNFYKYFPEALQRIGAIEFSELVQEANIAYETQNAKITQHQDGSLEGFSKSYEDNPLNDLDKKFYELNDHNKLNKIQVDYIRKHKAAFLDE